MYGLLPAIAASGRRDTGERHRLEILTFKSGSDGAIHHQLCKPMGDLIRFFEPSSDQAGVFPAECRLQGDKALFDPRDLLLG
jgi:hypothetical protein